MKTAAKIAENERKDNWIEAADDRVAVVVIEVLLVVVEVDPLINVFLMKELGPILVQVVLTFDNIERASLRLLQLPSEYVAISPEDDA